MAASIGHDLVFPNDLIGTKQEDIIHFELKKNLLVYPPPAEEQRCRRRKARTWRRPYFFLIFFETYGFHIEYSTIVLV
jgi:hypothetical protein